MYRKGKVFYSYDEETGPKGEKQQKPLWNTFRNDPRKPETGTNNDSKRYDFSVKAVKVLTYIVVGCVVLLSAVLSKATLLLMTSQVKKDTVRLFCNKNIDVDRKFIVELPTEERVLWIWILIFTFLIPQIGTLIKSLHVCLFKSWNMTGNWGQLPVLFFTETFPVIGSAILVFSILPELDVVKAAMLTNAFCFVPGIVGTLYRNSDSSGKLDTYLTSLMDITCLLAQLTSFFMWPLIEKNRKLYLIPISAIFISFGWWQNYVDENKKHSLLKFIANKKKKFTNETYFLYIIISITNCAIFFVSTLIIFWIQEGEINFLFNNFRVAFSDRFMTITQVRNAVKGSTAYGIDDTNQMMSATTQVFLWTPLIIFLINTISSFTCYAFVIFASKVSIQKVSFALPINITVPVLLSILIGISGTYLKDECAYRNILPEYLFFAPPPLYLVRHFLTQQYAWAWLLWLISQAWITYHIWNPKGENLARTEKLFLKPMYDPFLIDQSVCMNRRRDYVQIHKKESPDIAPTIYVCATMWREEPEEMKTFMESIMRLDEDRSAHSIAKHYVYSDIPNYYRLECHVFFDKAFIRDPNSVEDADDPLLNEYVLTLINSIAEAATEVHQVKMILRPPKIFSTPYGGRIEWILPGRTKLIVHLKDSEKIRAKKRWSQVMYLYYFLGFKMKCEKANDQEKFEELAKNTFILALDGDIDFKPEAMHLLVEYMKINDKLGAACGRIHPVGSGVLAWYQVFEYAVGHWLQKATEHVIGCVLCSPGCFSLFRASALSKNRVMAKYTTIAKEAKHRIQYDQGEDRWLCTLILKAGYRVEYSAASDSYTHCPVQFKVFYNQRKRWIPSTMANIVDVIEDSKLIVEKNDSISNIYIWYQTFLLIGTIIGPGTIFLMLVGASVTVFQMDQWTSFLMNLLPILIFVLICSKFSAAVQLKAAAILSSIYGLLMMAVLIGVILQIQDDGLMAPTSLFFFFMVAEFILAAVIHPKELYCLKYGIIYYVTVPSMYMLLMIYSVFNMNDISWGTRDEGVQMNIEEKPDENDAEKNEKTNGKTKKKKKKKNLINRLIEVLEASKWSKENVKQSNEEKVSPPKLIIDDASIKIKKNSWFYHKELFRGKVEWLSTQEEEFWKSLLKEYLEPIDEKEPTMVKNLNDLRDKMVSSFFMINALFVLVVFILTLKKDVIHIDWPYNAKVNFTYIQSENEIQIMKDYLQLEPIGFVFLLTFGALLFIQSFGMLIHRFGTFSQIIANTTINWFGKKAKKDTRKARKEVTRENAVEYVKIAQKLCNDDNRNDFDNEEPQVYDLLEAYKTELRIDDKENYVGKVDRDTAFQLKQCFRKSFIRVSNSTRESSEMINTE